jgi:hypothetical protein
MKSRHALQPVQISDLMQNNRILDIHEMAEEIGISCVSCLSNLTEGVQLICIPTKFIP